MKKIESIVLSWDTIFALIALVFSVIYVPSDIKNEFCTTIYVNAIAVLSIIFSIFFASLAVIMSLPDNDFITFLEHPGRIFTRLLNFFKITLTALFVALVYTICIFFISSYEKSHTPSSKPLFCVFVFLFTYSLFATAIAVRVTVKLTLSRATYIFQKKENEESETNGEA